MKNLAELKNICNKYTQLSCIRDIPTRGNPLIHNASAIGRYICGSVGCGRIISTNGRWSKKFTDVSEVGYENE